MLHFDGEAPNMIESPEDAEKSLVMGKYVLRMVRVGRVGQDNRVERPLKGVDRFDVEGNGKIAQLIPLLLRAQRLAEIGTIFEIVQLLLLCA